MRLENSILAGKNRKSRTSKKNAVETQGEICYNDDWQIEADNNYAGEMDYCNKGGGVAELGVKIAISKHFRNKERERLQ